ncbi:MAG: YciI family protein [Propionibacterium sp.]
MPFFAVQYTYDPAKDADAVRPRHRAYLSKLFDNGLLRASGPLPGTDPVQALLIFRTADLASTVELSDSDPMVTEGVVASRQVNAWDPVIGVFAKKKEQRPA